MTKFPSEAEPQPNWPSKRRYPRFRADLRLTATAVRDHQNVTVPGRCNLIAEGGLGAIMAGELVPGDVVTLEFSLPALEEPVQVRAVVRSGDGFHYGFEFIVLTPAQREAIRSFCKPLPRAQ